MRMIVTIRISNGEVINAVGDFQSKEHALGMAREFSRELFTDYELQVTNNDKIVETERWAKDNHIRTQPGFKMYNVGYIINGQKGFDQIQSSGVKSVYNGIKLGYGISGEFFALIHEINQVVKYKHRKKSATNESKNRLKNRDVNGIILKATNKMQTLPVLGDYAQDIVLLFGIVRDYANGSYRQVPVGTIVGALAAIIYFVSPIDVIPDFIPVVGQLDDAAVIIWAVKLLHDDLQEYRSWLEEDVGVEV